VVSGCETADLLAIVMVSQGFRQSILAEAALSFQAFMAKLA
jgi:hypothetical protein